MKKVLSWNEIRNNALAFQKEWNGEERENAEAKSFCDGFFSIFGVSRRRVASFEKKVRKENGRTGFIDLLWKGHLLIEFKSLGKDLDRAYQQARDYFPGLDDDELPKYVLVSDFQRFRLYDLDEDSVHEFVLEDLHKNVHLFGFIAGYEKEEVQEENPADIAAAELMGKLHDQLEVAGYEGHVLEVYLVRLLFCLFADDTGIFPKDQFYRFLKNGTTKDGADLGGGLAAVFQVLNTPRKERLKSLSGELLKFPYINGGLFSESLPVSAFTEEMRSELLTCCELDWSEISPSIFGSLFQWVMDTEERRDTGSHYTSEKNIHKLIKPLFFQELVNEFKEIRESKPQLREFQDKLASLKFFDPACGCGNFLVVTYKALRTLETLVLRALYAGEDTSDLKVKDIVKVDVDQFYGIELNEFPALIAQVAMWMTDHQMNLKVSKEFGKYFRRLPLRKSASIVSGNAVRMRWQDVCPDADYILGNPPFIGGSLLSNSQKMERNAVFHDTKKNGMLDYVSCWYRMASDYMHDNPSTEAAFVSTNSIVQGVQVGILWPNLLNLGVHINFAHRTFQWTSEARGAASVQCIIVGFSMKDRQDKAIYDYATPKSAPQRIAAKNINPYLVDAPNVTVSKRSKPLCSDAPKMVMGERPVDGGNLLMNQQEKDELVSACPAAAKWIKPYMMGREFLHNIPRYCLWLVGITPTELKAMPEVMERVRAVKKMRLASKAVGTQKLAETPYLFASNRNAETYIAIPVVSSEKRRFIPVGYETKTIAGDGGLFTVPHANLYHFGILNSTMHNAWMRAVGGRMKSDYRYSNTVVYNNFVWPTTTDEQQTAIAEAAQGILDARNLYPGSTLADLYDPETMPPELVKAHTKLDRLVDIAYGLPGKKKMAEAHRVERLFTLYAKMIEQD